MKETLKRSLAALSIVSLVLLLTAACGAPPPPPKGPDVKIVFPDNGFRAVRDQPIDVQSVAIDDKGVIKIELWVDGQIYRVDQAPTPGRCAGAAGDPAMDHEFDRESRPDGQGAKQRRPCVRVGAGHRVD